MLDCIIVGAGPAGATAGYQLAKQGRSVLVVDKETFPRYKPCGGGVSPAIAKWFDFDFTPVINNTVTQVKYTWKFDDPVEVELKGVTPMWMVRRDKFDKFLIERAIEQGAQFQDNLTVTGIERQTDKWQVNTSNGNLEAKYLIAADGANSLMAKWLGFEQQQKVAAASLEVAAEVPATKQNLAYFDFGSLKNGFMWCFPKTDGYSFSAAFVKDRQGKPEELKQQLTNYATKFGLDLTNSKYTEYNLNLWESDRKLHIDRALIAGEAAGIVDPLIGEGIRPAMFTGLQAASVINKALAGETNTLGEYTEIIKQEWGSNLSKAQFLAGLFYKAPKIAYKLGVKRPSAGKLMGKIICGELSYSDVADKATKKLKFIPGFGK
jgi:geranylgeranyl reductase family protein